jgi:Domain of unknown function (DUF2019)
MKPAQLQSVALRKSYERFISAGWEQHESLLYGDTDKYNRLFEEIRAIEDELKRRGEDERRALASLLDHPSAQVRLNAAVATLALEPEAARQALELISDRNEYPQAPYARDMLWALDRGTYKPS